MQYAKPFIAPLVTLVLFVGVFFAGLTIGQDLQKGTNAHERAEMLMEAYGQYQATINQERELTKKSIKGLENERNKIQLEYGRIASAGRLRIPATGCLKVPADSNTSGAGPAIARTIELPEEIDSSLRAIARDADEVVAQCRALTEWIGGKSD